jgi:class 3 adenylate cyclase
VTTTPSRLRLVRAAAPAVALKLPISPHAQAVVLDGLLALMVTDLEGFTALVDSLGDVEARAMIREHNLIVRSCLQRWRGYEIAHTGDGFIAAFRSVVAAIECAYELQYVLSARVPLRARVGVHAGEPLHDEGRLFGQCVNTAVRVCAHAEPGQGLVTDVVKQLARGRFSFGPGTLHTLKGVSQPIMLHEFDRGFRAERASVDAALDEH